MTNSLDSLKLDVIYRIMNGETFGLRQSERIVGGRTRLLRLIEEGKVRAEKEAKFSLIMQTQREGK